MREDALFSAEIRTREQPEYIRKRKKEKGKKEYD
jgi:hypothetical protein